MPQIISKIKDDDSIQTKDDDSIQTKDDDSIKQEKQRNLPFINIIFE